MADPTLTDVAIEQAELRQTIVETNKTVGRIENNLSTFMNIQYDINKRLSAVESAFDATLRDRMARVEERLRPIIKIVYSILGVVLTAVVVAVLALIIK